ncbi:hypothetical protein Tco_0386649 [Tanacetum coccineum]
MSRVEDDLFTYEVEIAEVTNIPCDLKKEDDSEQQMSHEPYNDMEYDPSDARGDDEVKLTDEESSDSDDDEVAKIFRIETDVFGFETPLCRAFKEFNYLLRIDPNVLTKDIDGFKTYEEYKDDWIYKWNKDVPWVHERPWTENGVWKEPTPVKHHYRKLKEEALKNKAIMKGMIDDNDESSNNGWRRWDGYEIADHDQKEREYKNEHEDEERCELFDHKLQYVAVKEDEYKDLTSTSEDSCRAYQEIFRMMDEGWMDLTCKRSPTKLVKYQSSGILSVDE